MASEVGIVNVALRMLGAKRIAALTDDNENAKRANDVYEPLRDYLMRSHVWNFAVKRRKLGQLATAPTYEYDYAYQLPSDWLRTVEVHDNSAGTHQAIYRIEESKVLSDAPDIWLRYVAKITDPNQMTGDFRHTLSCLIARDLALPVTNSNTVRQEMKDEFKKVFRQARSADSIEDFPDSFPEGSWSTARQGRTPVFGSEIDE